MITLGNVIARNTTQLYGKTDIDGVVVEGKFTYDINKEVVSASGLIRDASSSEKIASFNTYSAAGMVKVNVSECEAGKSGFAGEIADATLADLKTVETE